MPHAKFAVLLLVFAITGCAAPIYRPKCAARVPEPSRTTRVERLNFPYAWDDADRRIALREAAHEVLRIFGDKDFQSLLESELLIEGPGAEPAAIGAQVVASLLDELPSTIRLKDGWFFRPSTIAKTSMVDAHVRVRGHRVDEWWSGERGMLINTLAHEFTHLIPDRAVTTNYRYTDTGEGAKPCERAYLVSYRVGDLAQCFYENPTQAAACASNMVNGDRDGRPQAEQACQQQWNRKGALAAR